MKKSLIFIALIVVVMTLSAAVPIGNDSHQSLGKICIDPSTKQEIPCPKQPYQPGRFKVKIPGQGEPTMEKITYFYYMTAYRGLKGWFFWNWYPGSMKTFYVANYGCKIWYWRIHTWKTPVGCNFRYQY